MPNHHCHTVRQKRNDQSMGGVCNMEDFLSGTWALLYLYWIKHKRKQKTGNGFVRWMWDFVLVQLQDQKMHTDVWHEGLEWSVFQFNPKDVLRGWDQPPSSSIPILANRVFIDHVCAQRIAMAEHIWAP